MSALLLCRVTPSNPGRRMAGSRSPRGSPRDGHRSGKPPRGRHQRVKGCEGPGLFPVTPQGTRYSAREKVPRSGDTVSASSADRSCSVSPTSGQADVLRPLMAKQWEGSSCPRRSVRRSPRGKSWDVLQNFVWTVKHACSKSSNKSGDCSGSEGTEGIR